MRSDIEQVISSYIQLKRRGRVATGLCPFHSEKSPSFTVYPESQSFYCFGCGAGGDVITFVRRMESMDYMEAISMLAGRAGLTIPEDDDPAAQKLARIKPRILEANRILARFYHEYLKKPEGREALEYLTRRGVTNKMITRFGIGFAPNGWEHALRYLRREGFSEEELVDATLVNRRDKQSSGNCYDVFRNRVMFPIIDLRGNVIGFGGRIMEGGSGPKYLNSADSPVFKKSRNLFALNFAKRAIKKELLLCEGYMDVVAMHQAGFEHAVATLGTALTAEQARMISNYAQSVVLCYDSDEAGQAATRRAATLLDEVGVRLRVLTMADAKDPDEYIKKFGAERFNLLLENASGSTEYSINRLRDRFDLDQPAQRVEFIKEFVRMLTTLASPVEREIYLSKICFEFQIEREAVEAQLRYEMRKTSRKQAKDVQPLRIFSESQTHSYQKNYDFERGRNMKYALAEDKVLAILMKNPDYFAHAVKRLSPAQFVTSRNREIANILFRRAEQGSSIDLSLLAGELTIEQMGILAGLVQSVSGMQFDLTHLDAFIDTLLQAGQQKSQEEVAAMSPDDLKAYIASLAAKKK